MEITESALTERPEAVLRTLTRAAHARLGRLARRRRRRLALAGDDAAAVSRRDQARPAAARPSATRCDVARVVTAVGAEAERRHATVLAEGIDSEAQLATRARRRRDARAGLHARRARPAARPAAHARPAAAAGGRGRRPVRPAALPARDELEAADRAGRWSSPSARRRCSPRRRRRSGATGMLLAAPERRARARRATRRCATRSASSACSSRARWRTRGPRSRSARASARASSPAATATSGCSRPPTTASWSSSARCCSWRACRSVRHLADHLRDLRALPGERRGAGLLGDEPGVRDRLRVALAGGVRVLGVDLVAAGDDHRRRVDRVPGRSQSSNGRERGTACSASASASGCSWADEPLVQDAVDRLEPLLGDVRRAVGLDEPLDAALAQALRRAGPSGPSRRGGGPRGR